MTEVRGRGGPSEGEEENAGNETGAGMLKRRAANVMGCWKCEAEREVGRPDIDLDDAVTSHWLK